MYITYLCLKCFAELTAQATSWQAMHQIISGCPLPSYNGLCLYITLSRVQMFSHTSRNLTLSCSHIKTDGLNVCMEYIIMSNRPTIRSCLLFVMTYHSLALCRTTHLYFPLFLNYNCLFSTIPRFF